MAYAINLHIEMEHACAMFVTVTSKTLTRLLADYVEYDCNNVLHPSNNTIILYPNISVGKNITEMSPYKIQCRNK